jgi:hypothetical protein
MRRQIGSRRLGPRDASRLGNGREDRLQIATHHGHDRFPRHAMWHLDGREGRATYLLMHSPLSRPPLTNRAARAAAQGGFQKLYGSQRISLA